MAGDSEFCLVYFIALIGWLSTWENSWRMTALVPGRLWLRWCVCVCSPLWTDWWSMIFLFKFSLKAERPLEETGGIQVCIWLAFSFSRNCPFSVSEIEVELVSVTAEHTTQWNGLILCIWFISMAHAMGEVAGCFANGLFDKGEKLGFVYCKLQVRNNRKLNIRRTWLSRNHILSHQ